MYMTRDYHREGFIELWNCDNKDDLQRNDMFWIAKDIFSITLYPEEFKQLFPNQKLPRKGSCKWVELRLYIPGE